MKKLEEVEIYDKNGKALNIGNIIYSFLKTKANETCRELEHVYIGAYTFGDNTYLELAEIYDNGDDGYSFSSLGEAIKIKEE